MGETGWCSRKEVPLVFRLRLAENGETPLKMTGAGSIRLRG